MGSLKFDEKILGQPLIQIVVPDKFREILLRAVHGDVLGHTGIHTENLCFHPVPFLLTKFKTFLFSFNIAHSSRLKWTKMIVSHLTTCLMIKVLRPTCGTGNSPVH